MKDNLDDFKGAYSDSFPYSLDNRLMLNWYPKRVLNLAKGQSMLELGLGHGYTSSIFSQSFENHVVIEGSKEMIAKFRENFETANKVNIIQSYFEDFQSSDRFDVIVMGFILEHVEDPDFIIKKYKKLLKPGGKIFASVPNSDALNKRIGFEAGLIKDMSALSEADLQLGHRRIYNVESFKELFISNGLTIKTIEGIFLKPITTKQIKDLNLTEDILQAMLMVGIAYPELCVSILVEAETTPMK